MDPVSAGIMVGGTLLTNYLKQEAARKEQERMAAFQNAGQLGQNQQDALSNSMNYYKMALG